LEAVAELGAARSAATAEQSAGDDAESVLLLRRDGSVTLDCRFGSLTIARTSPMG